MDERDEVLDFWFGELSTDGRADEVHAQRWWKKEDAFDALIRTRFLELHAAITRREREAWLQAARGALAYVIVLDQFSRNMFRGSARMFESDAQASSAALAGIDRGFDRQLALDERGFLYMPLMHSEELAIQERCVAEFVAFRDELTGEQRERVAGSVGFAQQHCDIVRRFGRFPHRNSLLGRTSTAEEIEFLTRPGSSF